MSYRRRFQSPPVEREYRELHVIAVEGDRTEKGYFEHLGNELDFTVVHVKVIPPNGLSAPRHVFEKLKEYFSNPGLPGKTHLWMVIDKDQNQADELDAIYDECRTHCVEMCVSNPAFPFWLLLHFEKGDGIAPAESNASNISVADCEKRLREKRYLPGFNKHITRGHWKALSQKLERAVANAKALDVPRCKGYPKSTCGSTVYRLIEALLPFRMKTDTE